MNKAVSEPRIPGATYRLQFNRNFTFNDARSLIDYLHELGITDLYASPIFLAPPESNHGYDVCDYNRFNPMLGNVGDWQELTCALRSLDMGLLLDFVPNHMGAVAELNSWWRDVLEYGLASPYAGYFDIDWTPPDSSLKNRVRLPVLVDHYGRVLENGQIKLAFRQSGFGFEYFGSFWPLSPASYRGALQLVKQSMTNGHRLKLGRLQKLLPLKGCVVNRKKFELAKENLAESGLRNTIVAGLAQFNDKSKEPRQIEMLHELLEEQTYQLAFWRSGTRTANYRRFFDIDGLIAVNMDRPEVFKAAHKLILACVAKGQITGLRLDHIDGLADPAGYLEILQEGLAQHTQNHKSGNGRNFYVLVEKILMDDESLREDWPISGTTGYEFAAAVTGVMIDNQQEAAFNEIYTWFVPNQPSFCETANRSKRLVMKRMLSREIDALSRLLAACALRQRKARDLVPADLTRALVATAAAFPVYRTYLKAGALNSPTDQKILEETINRARSAMNNVDDLAFEFIRDLLLGKTNRDCPSIPEVKLFQRRFQQLTGPIMAKGCEDTAFFVYNRMIALNEVGGNPDVFGITPEAFHEKNIRRFKYYPHSMLTTSTHDTKLSEDARARAMALSQIPLKWRSFLTHARSANSAYKTCINGQLSPDENEEYRIYQILLSSWPLEKMSRLSRKRYVQRIQQHLLKALRDEKIHSRWDMPDSQWEQAVEKFVDHAVNRPDPGFRHHFSALAKLVAELGMVNSLSQTLIKLTAPGVPDIYQGNEIWQFLLTDPDNRQPVNFRLRQKLLTSSQNESPKSLLAHWQSGAIKMFLTKTILHYRRNHSTLFKTGYYLPLKFTGKYRDHCLGFARVLGSQKLLVLAPRLTFSLGFPPVGVCWGQTCVKLGKLRSRRFKDLFTGRIIEGAGLRLADAFSELPFAALVAE